MIFFVGEEILKLREIDILGSFIIFSLNSTVPQFRDSWCGNFNFFFLRAEYDQYIIAIVINIIIVYIILKLKDC